jgi:homogentisate 1,2-dioxygenase
MPRLAGEGERAVAKLRTFKPTNAAMPYYHQLGAIPHKRHTQFRQPDGSLYSEQLFSTEGFSNDYSLLYHIHPPTQIIKTGRRVDVSPTIAEEKMLSHRSLEGFQDEAS